MKKRHLFCLFWLILFPPWVSAQITVAIGDFRNESNRFALDEWEKKIPDYLHESLSGRIDIVLVARQDLKAVIEEHTLSMTGQIDSTTASLIGRLLSADYLVTGSIHQQQGGIRIDTRIIHTATGKIAAEKVKAPSSGHLETMVDMLAANISHQLTGRGDYTEKIILQAYPARSILTGTGVSLLATLLIHTAYVQKAEDYRNVKTLTAMDPSYNTANRLYKTRNAFMVLTGAGLAATLFCWLKNRNPEALYASEPAITPLFTIHQKETAIGIAINF